MNRMFRFEILDGEKVKEIIALKGESMRSFANLIDVSPSFISQVLNGKRKVSAVVAGKIAKGLDKKIDEIFLMKKFTGKQGV